MPCRPSTDPVITGCRDTCDMVSKALLKDPSASRITDRTSEQLNRAVCGHGPDSRLEGCTNRAAGASSPHWLLDKMAQSAFLGFLFLILLPWQTKVSHGNLALRSNTHEITYGLVDGEWWMVDGGCR